MSVRRCEAIGFRGSIVRKSLRALFNALIQHEVVPEVIVIIEAKRGKAWRMNASAETIKVWRIAVANAICRGWEEWR